MESKDIVALIRKRYDDNAHIVLEQVPNGTGAFAGSWIDVAVFSLWPSKGLTRSAFEVKVSRSDFIHELQDPLKNKWGRDSFHEFWYVAPKEVASIDELPEGTGLMSPHAGKLGIRKHCRRNENPKLDEVLLAAFMRASQKEIDRVKKTTEKELLSSSPEHQKAKAHMDAVSAFLKMHNLYIYSEEVQQEEIIKTLEKATVNPQVKADIDYIASVLDRFQREMAGLFGLFAAVAHKSILAKSEAGERLIGRYGDAINLETVELIKKRADSSKYDSEKRYAEMLELILNWGKSQE